MARGRHVEGRTLRIGRRLVVDLAEMAPMEAARVVGISIQMAQYYRRAYLIESGAVTGSLNPRYSERIRRQLERGSEDRMYAIDRTGERCPVCYLRLPHDVCRASIYEVAARRIA